MTFTSKDDHIFNIIQRLVRKSHSLSLTFWNMCLFSLIIVNKENLRIQWLWLYLLDQTSLPVQDCMSSSHLPLPPLPLHCFVLHTLRSNPSCWQLHPSLWPAKHHTHTLRNYLTEHLLFVEHTLSVQTLVISLRVVLFDTLGLWAAGFCWTGGWNRGRFFWLSSCICWLKPSGSSSSKTDHKSRKLLFYL